jgi:hypothetical protein
VEQLFAHDPEGAVLAFADMMKKGIVMPAHYMDDNWHSQDDANKGQNLFVDYATVADLIGVYTTGDYADIVQHLVRSMSYLRTAIPPCDMDELGMKETQQQVCGKLHHHRSNLDIIIAGQPLEYFRPEAERRSCVRGPGLPLQAL